MDFSKRVSGEELEGQFRAIDRKKCWRLPLRRGSVSSIGNGLQHHALPLRDLPARQRCSVCYLGRIRLDKFNFTEGQPVLYASSKNVLRTFCGRCGTALTYQRLDLPRSIDVTVGSMDDPEQLKPKDHTWNESRISWIVLDDHLPTYAQEKELK